jgi:hypothetical protein
MIGDGSHTCYHISQPQLSLPVSRYYSQLFYHFIQTTEHLLSYKHEEQYTVNT